MVLLVLREQGLPHLGFSGLQREAVRVLDVGVFFGILAIVGAL